MTLELSLSIFAKFKFFQNTTSGFHSTFSEPSIELRPLSSRIPIGCSALQKQTDSFYALAKFLAHIFHLEHLLVLSHLSKIAVKVRSWFIQFLTQHDRSILCKNLSANKSNSSVEKENTCGSDVRGNGSENRFLICPYQE